MGKLVITIPYPDIGILNDLRNFGRGLSRLFPGAADREQRDFPDSLEVVETDRIAYPKALCAPDAQASVIVIEALSDLVARNKINRPVGVLLSEDACMCRLLQPPPLEAKQLQTFIEYEATQQIPFPLREVQWRWLLVGDSALEAEVALLAARNAAVSEALQPFKRCGLEKHVKLLLPEGLATVEHLRQHYFRRIDSFDDQIGDRDWVAALEMHAERTQMTVSNGFRFWSRNIPLGGAHFTKKLAREMNLTFAKADDLKLNINESEVLIAAMRPVFNDMLTEVQRSLDFFRCMESEAAVGRLLFDNSFARLPRICLHLAEALELKNEELGAIGAKRSEAVTSEQWRDLESHLIHPYIAAVHLLGYGHFRANLLPNGRNVPPGAREAWGIEIGNQGVTAVKVVA